MLEALALAGAIHMAPIRIPDAWQPFAACVSQRESSGDYRARNRSSSASGRWQFLDTSWRVRGGIEWIVIRQMKKAGASWTARKRVYQLLTRTPIHRWPAWAQDAAFIGVITERPTGWRHWYAPGSRCNGLAP